MSNDANSNNIAGCFMVIAIVVIYFIVRLIMM